MVEYPAYGVNGRPANIEDIVIDEIARYFNHETSEFLYDDIIENNEGQLFDIVMHEIESWPNGEGLRAYGYDSLDDVDEYSEMLDIVDSIFTSSKNQFIYDYVYDIAELMLGSNWQEKLAKNEYADENDVIKTFYDMSKISIDDAFEKYASMVIDKMWRRI